MKLKKNVSLHPLRYKKLIMKYIALPEYVKQMRKQYRLTQVDLSEKSGVGLRFVRELEQGKKTLRMDKVNQILSLFGSELAPVPMDRNKFLI